MPLPCGGTHVAGLSQLGIIKITKTKNQKGNLRVSHQLGNIGKTPGAQVQQSSAPSDRMADFRHRCLNANRIDPRSA
jgi:alanyl-tRNA synthetase